MKGNHQMNAPASAAVSPEVLAQVFLEARSVNRFTERPVSPETLR